MLTNLPVPYDICVCNPISRLLTMRSMPVKQSVLIVVLDVKAVVAAFKQEKNLFVIVQLPRLIVYSTTLLLLASLHSEHDCELNVEQVGTKV